MNIKVYIIHTVVLHHSPHIDEQFALFLLEMYGKDLFPGVREAKRVYIDAGSQSYNGKTAEQNLAEGVLCLGVCGGMLDEHPSNGRGRIEGHSTATLVAKKLEISDNPELKQLLQYVRDRDLKGGDLGGRYGLATIVDTVSKYNKEAIVAERLAFLVFTSIVEDQKQFHGSSKEFKEHMSMEAISVPGGSADIAFGTTDSKRIHSYALGVKRSKIVIIGRNNGHVQIFCNKQVSPGVDMGAVTEAIRRAEIKACGNEVAKGMDLRSEGTLTGVSQWYFHKEAGNIFNGTERALNVKPTKLSIEDLKDIVVKVIGAKELQHS